MRSPWASLFCERRSPPIGFGATLPLSRKSLESLLTELTLTSKRAATLRMRPPSKTPATIRKRKSIESGLGIGFSSSAQDMPPILA